MPEITESTLTHWAARPETELYVEGGAKNGAISETTGKLGGRTVRAVKSADERDVMRKEYAEAKRQVQAAVIKIFGEEIGKSAYKVSLGALGGEEDQPITGRHVQMMMVAAQSKAKLPMLRTNEPSSSSAPSAALPEPRAEPIDRHETVFGEIQSGLISPLEDGLKRGDFGLPDK